VLLFGTGSPRLFSYQQVVVVVVTLWLFDHLQPVTNQLE